LFSDNEPVLIELSFQGWLAGSGVQHITTQTYSPKQNGLAENTVKQVVQKVSAMM